MQEIDVTAMSQPAVYVLRYKGEVVYVGQSECPMARVAAHRSLRIRQQSGGPGKWRGIKAIIFDSVAVIPTPKSGLRTVEKQLIQKYQPRYNVAHKHEPMIQPTLEELLGYSLPVKPKLEIGKRI